MEIVFAKEETVRSQQYADRLVDLIPQHDRVLSDFIGQEVRPSPQKAIDAFRELREAHQIGVVHGLGSNIAFMQAAIANGLKSNEESGLVAMAMAKLSLQPNEMVVNQIYHDDIVEIFDSQQNQVYRSFSCFKLCNYSIAELVAYPWYELYERPSWVTSRIMELGSTVYSGENPFMNLSDKFGTYSIKETLTPEKAIFMVQERFYARLLSTATSEPHVLSVKRIIPVEKKKGAADVAFL